MTDLASGQLYAQVVELGARYALAVDRGEVEKLADCFAPDALLQVGGVDQERGNYEIARRLTGRATPGMIHTCTGTVVGEIVSDRASTTSYFFMFDTNKGQLTAAGVYEDIVELGGGPALRWHQRNVIYQWRAG